MTGAAPYIISGTRVIRCYAGPSDDEEELHWSILGIVVDQDRSETPEDGSRRDVVLIGEFRVDTGSEVVAVTVDAQVSYTGDVPPGLTEDGAVALDEVRRIGGEAQHMLYDLAAGAARTIAGLTQLPVTVPLLTPESKVELFGLEEAGDEATDGA